eukprot:554109-Pyramimonas_sp.AAC.1
MGLGPGIKRSAFVRTVQLMNFAPDACVWGPFTDKAHMIGDKLGRPRSNFQPAQCSKSFCTGCRARLGRHGPSAFPGLRKIIVKTRTTTNNFSWPRGRHCTPFFDRQRAGLKGPELSPRGNGVEHVDRGEVPLQANSCLPLTPDIPPGLRDVVGVGVLILVFLRLVNRTIGDLVLKARGLVATELAVRVVR